MISFNVGPSQLYPAVRQYMLDAYDSGLLSKSHRSAAFSNVYRHAEQVLKAKLGIPQEYALYFFSSATECWQVLAESVVVKASYHLVSGNFAQRWYELTKMRKPDAHPHSFQPDDDLLELSLTQMAGFDTLCLTQNETSNGTQLRPDFIKAVRETHPEGLLAIDATSSMAGITLPFGLADIWFASVQKCFGLPAGLAVMLVNPKAVARIHEVGFGGGYNNLAATHKRYSEYQNTHTPNMLGIYLLGRVMEDSAPIAEIDLETRRRSAAYYHFFESRPAMQPLVQQAANRSDTVIAVKALPESVNRIKQAAEAEGMLLGSGYGIWKPNTFRIANFPAIPEAAVSRLLSRLPSFANQPMS